MIVLVSNVDGHNVNVILLLIKISIKTNYKYKRKNVTFQMGWGRAKCKEGGQESLQKL